MTPAKAAYLGWERVVFRSEVHGSVSYIQGRQAGLHERGCQAEGEMRALGGVRTLFSQARLQQCS
jgi:hypothetical protein